MANWQQELLEAEDRERQKRQGLDQPFGMYIDSVSGDSEIAHVSFHGNEGRSVSIAHPFISMGSWIRAIPEAGAQYVAIYRADEASPQPLTTTLRGTELRVQDFRSGKAFYRPLTPGEIEIHSIGAAQSYFSRRPLMENRGGIINRWADQDVLSAGDRAPIHHRQLFQYKYGTVGDEYRLGLVQRPQSSFEYFYPKVRDDFSAEQFVHVVNPANESPAILFTAQRGHVIDEVGTHSLQRVTQVPLRFQEVYYANDDSSTSFEIDEKGNYLITLATMAVEGMELYIPTGGYKETIELDRDATVHGNDRLGVTHTGTWIIGETLRITTGQNIANPRTTIETLNTDNEGSRFIMEGAAGQEKVILSTLSGHLMTFDDTDGKESIYVIHNSGAQMTFDQNGSAKIISKDGNYVFLDATTGVASIASAAGAILTLKDDVTFADSSGKQVFTFGGDTLQLSASKDVVIAAQTVTVKAGTVNLGDNPSFSSVLAEQLATLFDAHFHMSPLGPTSPPVPPMTAAIINANPATAFAAKFVKLRGNI